MTCFFFNDPPPFFFSFYHYQFLVSVLRSVIYFTLRVSLICVSSLPITLHSTILKVKWPVDVPSCL